MARAEVLRLDELVKNCILLFRNSVSTLTCEVEEGSLVYADKEQMRRVLINLLKNAEQSIPDGRAGEIRVTVKVFDRKVEIRVKDNGVGIPEELRKRFLNRTSRPNRVERDLDWLSPGVLLRVLEEA